MKGITKLVAAFVIVGVLAAVAAYAALPKTYQVTGPVVSMTADTVVDKDGDKWEIGRNSDTKVKGTLKVGAKVTIQYWMTATNVEVK
jgi:hypothetical protein